MIFSSSIRVISFPSSFSPPFLTSHPPSPTFHPYPLVPTTPSSTPSTPRTECSSIASSFASWTRVDWLCSKRLTLTFDHIHEFLIRIASQICSLRKTFCLLFSHHLVQQGVLTHTLVSFFFLQLLLLLLLSNGGAFCFFLFTLLLALFFLFHFHLLLFSQGFSFDLVSLFGLLLTFLFSWTLFFFLSL